MYVRIKVPLLHGLLRGLFLLLSGHGRDAVCGARGGGGGGGGHRSVTLGDLRGARLQSRARQLGHHRRHHVLLTYKRKDDI